MANKEIIKTPIKQKTSARFKRLAKLLKLKSEVLVYDKAVELMEKFKNDFPCIIEHEIKKEKVYSIAYGIDTKYEKKTYIDSKNRAICPIDEANKI